MEKIVGFDFPCLIFEAFVDFLDFYKIDYTDIKLDTCIVEDISKRYHKDEKRLMENHSMKGVNAQKAAGYITYWLVKLRPISINTNLENYRTKSTLYLYINEAFAFYVATGRLSSTKKRKDIVFSKDFLISFLYILKYRPTTGDNLTMHYYLMDKH